MLNKISEVMGAYGLWRMMVNFWTVIFLSSIVFDFFYNNVLEKHEILLGIATIYVGALAIYSAEKEFRRWHNVHDGLHPGELYAILWTLLVVSLVVMQFVYNTDYHMPPEVSASYIAVIGILAITRESKNFYNKKKRKK